MNNKLEFALKMQGRTKALAVEVVKFFGKLPKTDEARVLGRQLLRSGTSVAANYRAVCRANQTPISFTNWGPSSKKSTKVCFGLNFLKTQEFVRLRRSLRSKKNPTN